MYVRKQTKIIKMFTRILNRRQLRLFTEITRSLAEATKSKPLENDGKFVPESSSTVDAKEISQFKSLVSSWWNEQGQMKPLHSMNKLRIPLIRDGLKNRGKLNEQFINTSTPLKNIKILDIGCGGGILCEPLAKLGASVTGIDACEDLIVAAKLHSVYDPELKDSITYVYGALEDLSATYKEKFDAVIASEIVEHVASKDLFLKSCVETLKPGGSLFITTLNKTILSWLGGIIGAEYIFKFVPKGTHDWNKFVAPHEIQKILELNGCNTQLVHGMCYNFLSNKWYWISPTEVSYALHAVKC